MQPTPATTGQLYPANEVLSSFPLLVPSAELGGMPVGILRATPTSPPWLLILSTDPAGEFESAWGEYGQNVPGCDSRVDGFTNTLAMFMAGCEAATRLHELNIGGHNDWYIPARAEALLCHAVAKDHLPKGWMWTSTQYSANHAWTQTFDVGIQYGSDKRNQSRVRAVRRLILQ